jgi:hypothetical protein
VESSIHSIPALYELCQNTPLQKLYIEEGVFHEAQQLLIFGWKYETVQNAFEFVNKGQFNFFVAQKDPRITFVYSSPDADYADTQQRSLEVQEMHSPKADVDISSFAETVSQILEPLLKTAKCDRCDYEYSSDLVEIARDYGRKVLLRTNLLEVPEDTTIGKLTFKDLHRFWSALLSICYVHIYAHLLGAKYNLHDLSINSIVLCRARSEFAQLISRISELAIAIVEQILGWLIYDPKISSIVSILQPFLSLGSEVLCLPTSYVNGNSFERNFRKLMYYHPLLMQFTKGVEKRLEPTALDSLAQLFPEPDYRVRQEVVIPGVTDVDLLVFERETNFTLAIQHKWLIAPDTLKESAGNDRKLTKGVSQAISSCEYLRNNHSFLRAKLDLPNAQEIGPIEGVVICRGAEATGFLGRTNVPILLEDSFGRLLAQASNFLQLWILLNARPDYENAEKYSQDIKNTIRLCGYEFVIPGMAVQLDQ